jgi:hypothetical protein
MISHFINIMPIVEQPHIYTLNEWKSINNEYINEIVNITYNELIKKNKEIIINYDRLYDSLVRYIYNTSFNKYKSYLTYE